MKTALPELIDTDLKCEAARAKLADAQEQRDQLRNLASEAARKVTDAKLRLQRERNALLSVQQQLTEALRTDAPAERLQQKVAGCRANIDSLQMLLEDTEKAAVKANQDILQADTPTSQAQTELDIAEVNHLKVRYIEAILSAIPIARELLPRARAVGQSLEQSGLMINIERPNLGIYTIDDDGTVRIVR